MTQSGSMSFKLCLALLLLLCLGCREDIKTKAQQCLNIEDYDRAILFFNQYLDQSPMDKDARYGLALAHYSLANLEDIEKESTGTYWKNTIQAFHILNKMGMTQDMKEIYSNAYYKLARYYVFQNDLSETLDALENALQHHSQNYYALNLKGYIYSQNSSFDEAEMIFNRVIEEAPGFISPYINLGNQQWKQKKYEDAYVSWSMGLSIDSTNSYLKKWLTVAEEKLKEDYLFK